MLILGGPNAPRGCSPLSENPDLDISFKELNSMWKLIILQCHITSRLGRLGVPPTLGERRF
jgi:hypothetical protein